MPLVVAAFRLEGAAFGAILGASVAASAGLQSLDWVAAALAVLVRHAPRRREAASAPTPAPPVGAHLLLRLWVVFAAGSLGGLVALGLAQPISADRGAGAWLSAAAVVAVALGNVSGRLGAGLLARRLAPQAVVGGAQALGGLALALLLLPTGPVATALLMTGVALGYGLTAAGVPLLARRAAGPEAFAHTFGIVFTGWGAAGLIGPWLAADLRDRTGNRESGLALGGSLVALAALATGRWTRR